MRASRWSAASALARRTAASRSGVQPVMISSSRMPAACITASTGWAASSRATASRSPVSQATTVTFAPSRSRSARRTSAPGASGPRRLVRTSSRAPRATAHRATREPSAPVPPVTRTRSGAVHSPVVADTGAGAGTSLRACAVPPRTATWSSAPEVRTAAARASARRSGLAGRSSSPPQRSGCSRAATRPSPHTAAALGSTTASVPVPTVTAPLVNSQRGAVSRASAWAWTTASAVATPGRQESTPASGAPPPAVAASVSRAASVARSASAGQVRRSMPGRNSSMPGSGVSPGAVSSDASALTGWSSSHRPVSAPAGTPVESSRRQWTR
ncbi:hypothetical protein SALBM217S_01010 [Streptomyces griseoloalbus]